jgi:hypothetical protein
MKKRLGAKKPKDGTPVPKKKDISVADGRKVRHGLHWRSLCLYFAEMDSLEFHLSYWMIMIVPTISL